MKLNIYEKREVIKTYEIDTYDLMFGTVEDVAKAIKLDDLKEGTEVEIMRMAVNLVVTSFDTVKDLLKDMFDGITDEELKKTKVKEVAAILVEVVTYTIKQLNIGAERKNLRVAGA